MTLQEQHDKLLSDIDQLKDYGCQASWLEVSRLEAELSDVRQAMLEEDPNADVYGQYNLSPKSDRVATGGAAPTEPGQALFSVTYSGYELGSAKHKRVMPESELDLMFASTTTKVRHFKRIEV
jgi:hypothetical protein